MSNQNTANQAAETNPLSDEYVNAVIQQHGYQSPETVIARLNQWIGLHGGENAVTLLMYEAHKALVKLRASVADEDDQPTAPDDDAIAECWVNASDCDGIAYDGPSFERGYRAALAIAPVAGEATYYAVMHGQALFGIFETETAAGDCIAKALYPKVMSIRPLYAAPQASKPDVSDAYEGAREDLAIWKRRALEAENLLRIERETSCRLVAELNATNGPAHMGEPAPQASEAAHKEAAAMARSFGAPDMADALDPAKRTGLDGEAVRNALHDLVDVMQKRHFGRMPEEVQRAFDAARAALSAQPGAQKGGSDAD